MAGRIELVKTVITSSLLHSLRVYSLPKSLLLVVAKAMRNFIWSGSVENRKMISISWGMACKPVSNGGLGIRNFSS